MEKLGALGAFLLVLIAIFLLGRIWFALAEGLIAAVKGLFSRGKEPPAWHPLPQDWSKPLPFSDKQSMLDSDSHPSQGGTNPRQEAYEDEGI